VSEVRTAICDLDGTLLDSDEALVAAFLALGIDRSIISFGHVISEECDRLGISLDDYVTAYDTETAEPFAGVIELVEAIPRWAICSNKHVSSGTAELQRLHWKPEVAMFGDVFNGPKRLQPVLDAMGLDAADAVFLGDTDHDRRCARDAGVDFILAGWNPRARAMPGDVVLTSPMQLLELLVP
jgi:HAD superfamily hydrolase (TIGR01549 family)